VALRRLSTSSIQTNGKSSKLWDQTTFQSGMFAIATVSLTSSASVVTFSGIPSNYTHLQIRANCLTTGQEALNMYYNTDSTGSNYRDHQAGSNQVDVYAYSNAGVNTYGAGIGLVSQTYGAINIIDILDYANTSKNKVARSLWGADRNGSGATGIYSHLWLSQLAINSITLSVTTYPFQANSSFSLYGIKV
jgi:hypothetical protein